MPDYIKQVTVTGDVSTIVDDVHLLEEWCAEIAKEIWEQKPEFGIIHIQGLRAASNPDHLSERIIKSEKLIARFSTGFQLSSNNVF
ncbi:hypothetical protein AB6A40_009593 [Gnathostoma spinigerum]|uniref:Uncharacterized protein n=1 Tax=Gnathostoma spinigerum TaxID=75299 RepID=A0ABD6EXK1_9BILA